MNANPISHIARCALISLAVLAGAPACSNDTTMSAGYAPPEGERRVTEAAGAQEATGVFVNGRQMSGAQLRTLEEELGRVPPGSYWFVDQEGSPARLIASDGLADESPDESEPNDVAVGILALREMMRAAGADPAFAEEEDAGAWGHGDVTGYADAGNAGEAYEYATSSGSGERNAAGDWSHYSDAAGGAVGGTADGCIYAGEWSNC